MTHGSFAGSVALGLALSGISADSGWAQTHVNHSSIRLEPVPAASFRYDDAALNRRLLALHQGDSTVDGAVIGGVVGGAAGLFLLTLGSSYGGSQPEMSDRLSSFVVGALIGAVAGAVIDEGM